METVKKTKIIYYSGTGGAERVAHHLEIGLKNREHEVTICRLKAETLTERADCDLLVVVFAVHACNAPELIYRWIKGQESVNGVPAVVISVSGGGEVLLNTASRRSCIKRLEKKGYDVVYERMIVMPSNWITPTKKPLALLLLEVLPERTEVVVDDVVRGVRRRTRPLGIDVVLSKIGELEKVGARLFGRWLKVSQACTGCGWCGAHCPAGNITLRNSKPTFADKCHLCLGCIYGCPVHAIEPRLFRFFVIKDGYNLDTLEKELPLTHKVDVEQLAQGYLWSGVKKYLLDGEQ